MQDVCDTLVLARRPVSGMFHLGVAEHSALLRRELRLRAATTSPDDGLSLEAAGGTLTWATTRASCSYGRTTSTRWPPASSPSWGAPPARATSWSSTAGCTTTPTTGVHICLCQPSFSSSCLAKCHVSLASLLPSTQLPLIRQHKKN